MLFRKYDFEKRTSFVFNDEDLESLNYVQHDIDRVKIIINKKYQSEIMDSPPYHFIITKNGVFDFKATDLAHSDTGYLTCFNHDIRFLIVGGESVLVTMQDEISKKIAETSSKYSLKISGNIIISLSKNFSKTTIIKTLEKKSIKERHLINPIMSIYESVIDDEIITNKNIIPASNRHGFKKIKNFADRFSIPVSVLEKLNPHTNYNALKISDTIFLPATTGIAGKLIALYCKKQAEYIYEKCRYLAHKGGDIDG